MYPDFICIGAQKAGTTWLYRNLQLHPGVWLPPEKELHYFDEKRRGPHSWRGKLLGGRTEDVRWRRHFRRRMKAFRHADAAERRWALRYLFRAPSDAWYASLFEPGRERRTGEVTPAYSMLEDSEVAEVARLMPELKVIFLMRNPIERAWSHAMMDSRILDEHIAASPARLLEHFESQGSRLRTDYARTLDNWSAHVPAERIFVGFVEDISFHPQGLIDRVWDFLEVDRLAPRDEVAERVHEGSDRGLPVSVAERLAAIYRPLTVELDHRFGGYASWWRFCAEQLLRGAGGGDRLATPLHSGDLWWAWLGRSGDSPPLQSAALAHLARAVSDVG